MEVYPSASCEVWPFAVFQCTWSIERSVANLPPASAPPAGPGERRVLWVPVFRWRRCTGGFHLGADQFGKGVAQIPGEGFHLGAGFRLLPILEDEDRHGDVLLEFVQPA